MFNLSRLARLLYFFPVLVVLFEYIAFSSALAYARYASEYLQPEVYLLGGLVKVGDTLPYDAVPNAVVTLHLLSLLLSVMFLVYFMLFGWRRDKDDRLFPYGEE